MTAPTTPHKTAAPAAAPLGYVMQWTERSFCGACGHEVALLMPDWAKAGDPIDPSFYVCLNDGTVGRVGVAPVPNPDPAFVAALRSLATSRKACEVTLPTGQTVRVRWDGPRWTPRAVAN